MKSVTVNDIEYDISELECTECQESEWAQVMKEGVPTTEVACIWCDHVEDLEEVTSDDDPHHEPPLDPELSEEDQNVDIVYEKESGEVLSIEETDPETEEEDSIGDVEQTLIDRVERQAESRINTYGTIPEKNMTFSELKPKELMFCNEYIVDFNATRAAKKAGYSEKSARQMGYKLLTKGDIQQCLAALKMERMVRLEETQDNVIGDINITKDRCMQAYPVYDSQGYPTGDWEFKPMATLKALELKGKHLGMFITQKLEHGGVGGVPLHFLSDIALKALTLDQLKQLDEIMKTSDKWKKENNIKGVDDEQSPEVAGNC